ncbi:MAG: hypothetical protein ACYDFT_04880 [Thermoplasmata archaeon]
MTRTHGSGGYQGAISSMISIVDVCPSCGRYQPDHRRRYPFAAPGQCPEAIRGAFPYVMSDSSAEGYDEPSSPPKLSTPTDGYPPAADEAPPGVLARGTRPSSRSTRHADLLLLALSLASGPEDFP